MLGYGERDSVNTFVDWVELIYPHDLGEFLLNWTQYMEGERTRFSMEYRLQSKSGEYIWLELMGVRYSDEHGAAYRMAGTHKNIHFRKCAEIELHEYRERLELLVQERTVELQRANETLERFASTDALTGVSNRRSLDAMLEGEYRRTARDGSVLSLLMIDVDFFKDFDDHFGHQAGDLCLSMVAQAIKQVCSRTSDFVARYGGEEFVVLLPQTGVEGALQVAESVRMAVQELNIQSAKPDAGGLVSVSIGVAQSGPGCEFAEKLLRTADEALYRAKHAGRNQISLGSPT